MTKHKLIFLILSCIWMVVIFYFSARDADESEDDSYRVGLAVGRVFVPDFESMSEDAQLEFAESIDHPVRKCAHATEYAILGMFLVGVFYPVKKRSKSNIIYPLVCCVLYAATDEIHQLFVPGRSGQLFDVLIDGAGALVGILVIIFILERIKMHK
ncbi:MAG: VanZ family protein [Lachnospiraceae bacterium]|nr:VanZ family protein [Lachnospiraceae bacterium]